MCVADTVDNGVYTSEVRLQAEQREFADHCRAAFNGKHCVWHDGC